MIQVITNNGKTKTNVTGTYEELIYEFFTLLLEFSDFLHNFKNASEEELK